MKTIAMFFNSDIKMTFHKNVISIQESSVKEKKVIRDTFFVN